MRAIAIIGADGPESASLHDLPAPEPGPGEVRVALAASSLNHADIWASRGQPRIERRFPFILGIDGAGSIDAVGEGVTDARIGEEVVLNPILSCGRCARCAAGERMLCRTFRMLGEHVDGTHADAVCVPTIGAVPRPPELDAVTAAAGATVYATAYRMLFSKGRLAPGERVLIHGIGGGLALAALQLAKTAGATCVVTSSDDTKLERALALGADHAVNYRQGDLVAAVRSAVGAADVIIDSVGAAVWDASFRLLAENGRLVNAGAAGGDRGQVPIVHLFWRQLEVIGSSMASDGEFRDALRFVVANGLRPVIDRTVPLEGVPEALLALERGEQFGKIAVSR